MITSQSARYQFDSLESAAESLIVLLEHARSTKADYRFSGLSPQQALMSGIHLEGDIQDVCDLLDEVPGSVRTAE